MDSILNIDKFQKRPDKFNQGQEKKCISSISWEELKDIKDPKKYIKKLDEINTNPKYQSFIQIYFHAGDIYQYQKYGYLKARSLSYPTKPLSIKGLEIYNNYNLETTYQTFLYLFEHLKKGIYVSIRNNQLDVFLPFSNIGYKNNWSDILEKLNPGLMRWLKSKHYNISDPSHWYANNCIINTNKIKFTSDRKEYIEEGDKTEVPFKYFLLDFIKFVNDNGKKINDMDFFFNPRDFPVFKHDYLEPYENLHPKKKLDKKYIHKTYTPILSQCGNINYHDIPIPTEDDMMRITKDIYPDTCKNNYNKKMNFEMDFSNKKPICVFRGSATGCGITVDTNMRLKAAYLSELLKKHGKNILDVKLSSWNKKPKADALKRSFGTIKLKDNEYFHKGVKITAGKFNFMNLEEQSKHKYILNIDGHVKAFRLGNELQMGSVILLVDSPYTLWFQDKLKEYEHYVPVLSNLNDLEKQINWCIKSEDKCKQIAKNALDFYHKYLSKEGTYEYFHNLLNNLSTIRREPMITNVNDNKLNIIVAYRDNGDGSRKSQLDIFLEQMKLIFEGRTDYHIYIIEQESDRKDYEKLDEEHKQKGSNMAKFNLGRLKNIGFHIANEENKDVKNAYYVLSDVDLLPSNELIDDYLKYPKTPIHLGNKGTRYNVEGKDDKYFLGGVLSFNEKDFIECNGYPNNFWGWGGEDNALLYRLNESKIIVEKSKYPVIDLEEESSQKTKRDVVKEKTDKLWEKDMLMKKEIKKRNLDKNKVDWKTDGILNIEGLYKITNKTQTGGAKNISHIKVNLIIGDIRDSFKRLSIEELNEERVRFKGLSIEELYEEYKRCKITINKTDDHDIKNDNKILIQDIKEILDDKELDENQLKEIYNRKYLSYPDYNNPNFNEDISKKLEFNSNKIYFDQQTACGKENFELGNHQRMLKNFVNKKTPYKSLLIFHGVGVGKTCSAVTISESFRDIYVKENNKIIVLRKGGLGQGWKNTIFDPSKGENQCSGHEFFDFINERKGFEKRDNVSIKRDVNKLIKNFYEFYAYREFSNSIDKLIELCSTEDEERIVINKIFSNRLLIVDEYHNLRDEDIVGDEKTKKSEKEDQKKALKNLIKIIQYSDNLRIILLTATPMFNYSDEIFNLLNILLLNDNRPMINFKDYIKDGNINEEGLEVLSKKFKGYVSYLRGENPINFPIRIYPTDYKDPLALLPKNAPKNDLFGKPIKDNLKFLITYNDKLQGEQKKAYEKLSSKLDEDKKIGIQDSNLTQICNVYYPSNKNEYGLIGFNSVFNNFKGGFKYKKDMKPILSYKLLNNYSIKIKNIIDNILDSEGIIFIYSEYIWAGAVPIGIALEHIGFNKYGNKNLLNYDDKGSEKGNYIILSGDDKISNNNDEEIKILTSDNNKDGNLIKIVIGSSITGEGMDFKNIRQIHILDPWWHLSKLEQIIGRGIRYCSHSLLPEEKRNVTVFLHTATCDNKETIDHYNYRRGEKKSIEIGIVETILKKNAFDCYLFKEGNVIKNMKNLLKIDMKVSKKDVPEFKKSLKDKPYSKICSYQKLCDYSCNIDTKNLDKLQDIDTNNITLDQLKIGMDVSFNYKDDIFIGKIHKLESDVKNKIIVIIDKKEIKVPISKLKILNIVNDDTIDFKYFNDLKKNILVYLNILYKKNKFYVLDDIVEFIQYNKNINKKVIYNLLKNIIDSKDKIYDACNNQGYIICRGDTLLQENNVYIFQPVYNNDESTPLFYREYINSVNKINIDTIADNIKSELDNLIIKKKIVLPEINSILNKIKKNYKDITKYNILKYFKLINNDLKDIYFESCIDELSYEEKKVLIEDIIKNYKKKGDIINNSYNYFKNNFIQQVGSKYTLFNYDKPIVGYIILNKDILEYRDSKGILIDKSLIQNDILESIKELSKSNYDKLFKMNKIWIHPYINYTKKSSETNFRYTYKFYDGSKLSKGVIIGNDPGYTKTFIKNVYSKLNIDNDIFKFLKNNFDKLLEDKWSKAENKFKLIQIVFRIKDKLSDNRYFINSELNYLRLNYLKLIE